MNPSSSSGESVDVHNESSRNIPVSLDTVLADLDAAADDIALSSARKTSAQFDHIEEKIKEEMKNGKVIMRRLHLFESWDVRFLLRDEEIDVLMNIEIYSRWIK
jgi:hypothetical protein